MRPPAATRKASDYAIDFVQGKNTNEKPIFIKLLFVNLAIIFAMAATAYLRMKPEENRDPEEIQNPSQEYESSLPSEEYEYFSEEYEHPPEEYEPPIVHPVHDLTEEELRQLCGENNGLGPTLDFSQRDEAAVGWCFKWTEDWSSPCQETPSSPMILDDFEFYHCYSSTIRTCARCCENLETLPEEEYRRCTLSNLPLALK
eukprot:snap_masked-scaffold_25-processed-gene-4.41-mRNA-1 protein AED:1.00 eAED:1.00 QI:0/-1/0/0/-1/1/1/0/200